MTTHHILVIAICFSALLTALALGILVAALGWDALWLLLGALGVFVILSLARDAVSRKTNTK